ncbi:FAD/NAD(P)-binding protein [uncultured Jatrophihabitans sp.]|uniref:FAD/NAD(P)-binding protein n=1 Tax=uncultured Jatrophihabitans sp. TaxID=1610747 RepID=UPI0035CB7D28
MTTRACVAVIGAGASGTIAAAHLVRRAGDRGRPIDLLLIDSAPAGRGLAYSTTDPRHRLNVPAKGMSAWPDEPDHFLRWLRRHVAVDFPAGGFAPRVHYAQYLSSVLDAAARTAGERADVRLEHVRGRVADVRRIGRRLRLAFADGTNRPADAVVLALGHGEPATAWAPAQLRREPRFVADPWRPAAEPTLRHGDEVVIVGAGLTAVDMAQSWGREGVRVHIVSRHGMLPLPHANAPQPPVTVPLPAVGDRLPATLSAARREVFAAIRAADGDWRRVVDGLRPITATLWAGLPDAERRAFLRAAGRRWDRVRHRVDPAVHDWLAQRRADGSLVVHAGTVAAAHSDGDRLAITLSDGTEVRAAAVLNCTGSCTSINRSADPLIMNLTSSGLIRSGPLDLGLATDERGRLLPDRTSGAAAISALEPAAMWTLGPLRRGELWESTAVPEIRAHAARLAGDVLDALPSEALRRRPRDPYGLPISASAGAAGAYVGALHRILRVQSGAEALVADAVTVDPEFALGHAVLAVLGVEWGADVDVEAALAKAHAPGARADERERRFIEVATARVREPGPQSAAALIAYLQTYPEDALGVSLAVPTIAFGGATDVPTEAWALVDTLQPAYGDDWWYRGLLAFTRQEQERYAEAGELAALALAAEPAAGHAVHAKAHVHYETGDHQAGLDWLDAWIATCGAKASHRAHFSWHAALHELALGEEHAVVARYAAQLAPPHVSGVRALVDSAALLWRARMTGTAPLGDIRAVLDVVPAGLLAAPPTPFVALHAAIAMAAAGDCAGLARLRRDARAHESAAFRGIIAPLAAALGDVVHDDPEAAMATLLALGDEAALTPLGGSAAQREIVRETLLHCAVAGGRPDVAVDLLSERIGRRDSPADRARRDQLVRLS